jgi:hypothetical protein
MQFSLGIARWVIKGDVGRREQDVAEIHFDPEWGNCRRTRSSRKTWDNYLEWMTLEFRVETALKKELLLKEEKM